MTLGLRLILAVGFIGGLGILLMLASQTANSDAATGTRWQSSGQCAACHERVFAEWQGSHHQISYLNPEVRKLSDDFRNKECQACHLPRPVFQTGLLERTLPRVARPAEGVDCLTCHLAANGDLLARNARPDVPCQPKASPEMTSVALCETCHNQHKTTDQWRASPYAAQGTTCNDCHMPEVGQSGRSHVFAGAHDIAMLRRAGEFEVAVKDSEVLLRLTNVGAGHSFPTEERHRAVDIEYRYIVDGHPATEAFTRAYRFRQPYRDEAGEDTQLPAGETVEVSVPIPAGATAVQARLWYRLYPFATDAESTLLFEREVPLP